MKRKICVVTGSRAEYGLLYWLLKELEADPEFELQIAVTGMHLSPEFGLTYRVIEEDGFTINEKVEILLSGDTPSSVSKSMGLAMIGFSDALERLRPDAMVALGDRFEIFSACAAALVARVPIAHIHGGELTEGAMDDAMRHSITKMAQLHFVAADRYRQRVIQLGEHPDRVHVVGAIGLDNIKRLKLLERDEFEKTINFSLGGKSMIVTFHPATLDKEPPKKQFGELLAALDGFPDYKIIFTKPNADTGGRGVMEAIDRYVSENSEKAVSFTSMGQLNYLSALKHVNLAVGNSSSGIIEVPSFGIPTVNIGDRQKGRLMGDSVICCGTDRESVITAINKGISSKFAGALAGLANPYGRGDAAVRIKKSLKQGSLYSSIKKVFYDIPKLDA